MSSWRKMLNTLVCQFETVEKLIQKYGHYSRRPPKINAFSQSTPVNKTADHFIVFSAKMHKSARNKPNTCMPY